jgi:hypothetical protein
MPRGRVPAKWERDYIRAPANQASPESAPSGNIFPEGAPTTSAMLKMDILEKFGESVVQCGAELAPDAPADFADPRVAPVRLVESFEQHFRQWRERG